MHWVCLCVTNNVKFAYVSLTVLNLCWLDELMWQLVLTWKLIILIKYKKVPETWNKKKSQKLSNPYHADADPTENLEKRFNNGQEMPPFVWITVGQACLLLFYPLIDSHIWEKRFNSQIHPNAHTKNINTFSFLSKLKLGVLILYHHTLTPKCSGFCCAIQRCSTTRPSQAIPTSNSSNYLLKTLAIRGTSIIVVPI